MIIPSKHSGYQAGIRLYPGGGSGGGTTTYTPNTPAWGTTEQSKANYYNQQLGAGQNDAQIRANVDSLAGTQSDANWGRLVQTAGTSSPTGRPLPGSAQFFQPVYNGQSPNYNTGNSMGVSQYGQQMQTPFTSQPQTSMFNGQMQGGGYGQYGSNNPFSPYSNSYLNIDPNLSQGTQADKANMYRNAIQSGFGDQQIRGQAEGLFGQQSPQAWGYLQGSAMGMNPNLAQGSEADKVKFYQGARNQGFNDQTIRSAANQMMGNQNQGDWSYLQNRSGYGGNSGGYGNQYMPQMQTPFSYQPMQQQMQTPFSYPQQSYQQSYQPSYPTQLPQYVYDTISDLDQYRSQPVSQPVVPQRTSSGPSQAIVGRSSQMRGTPNVMRRAEGGIASLMDDEE